MDNALDIYFWIRVKKDSNIEKIKQLLNMYLGDVITIYDGGSKFYFKPISLMTCEKTLEDIVETLRQDKRFRRVKIVTKEWNSYLLS